MSKRPTATDIAREKRAALMKKKEDERNQAIDLAKREYRQALKDAKDAIGSAGQAETYAKVTVCDNAYRRLVRLIKKDAAREFAKTEALA